MVRDVGFWLACLLFVLKFVGQSEKKCERVSGGVVAVSLGDGMLLSGTRESNMRAVCSQGRGFGTRYNFNLRKGYYEVYKVKPYEVAPGAPENLYNTSRRIVMKEGFTEVITNNATTRSSRTESVTRAVTLTDEGKGCAVGSRSGLVALTGR